MSRSNTIWIVVASRVPAGATTDVLAAFTVKHELAAWLEKNGHTEPKTRDQLVGVLRIPDGGQGKPQWFNPRTLEPAL